MRKNAEELIFYKKKKLIELFKLLSSIHYYIFLLGINHGLVTTIHVFIKNRANKVLHTDNPSFITFL